VEVNGAAAEPPLVQQLEPEVLAPWQGSGSPTHDHRGEEKMALVDEPGSEHDRGSSATYPSKEASAE
jgi:hypothetical protein